MLNFHQGVRYQEGRGLGSIFGSIFRGLKPLAKMGLSAGKRLLTSDFVKQELLAADSKTVVKD